MTDRPEDVLREYLNDYVPDDAFMARTEALAALSDLITERYSARAEADFYIQHHSECDRCYSHYRALSASPPEQPLSPPAITPAAKAELEALGASPPEQPPRSCTLCGAEENVTYDLDTEEGRHRPHIWAASPPAVQFRDELHEWPAGFDPRPSASPPEQETE